MYYIVDSEKSIEVAAADLESAVKRHAFGLMHVHDLGSTLRSKGILFEDECKVFEICNPVQASKVLSQKCYLLICVLTWHYLVASRYIQIKKN